LINVNRTCSLASEPRGRARRQAPPNSSRTRLHRQDRRGSRGPETDVHLCVPRRSSVRDMGRASATTEAGAVTFFRIRSAPMRARCLGRRRYRESPLRATPSRCMECSRRVVSTAPFAPIGCPCAMTAARPRQSAAWTSPNTARTNCKSNSKIGLNFGSQFHFSRLRHVSAWRAERTC
jgi:hypothetical protein